MPTAEGGVACNRTRLYTAVSEFRETKINILKIRVSINKITLES